MATNYPRRAPPADPEWVRLGRWLFFDKRLSRDGDVSCGDCHVPDKSFSVSQAFGIGTGGVRTLRKPLPLVNLAWRSYPHFNWDGNTDSLEDQALAALQSEMGVDIGKMVLFLEQSTDYSHYFRKAFGSGPITPYRVASSIADYERSLVSGGSPWDLRKQGLSPEIPASEGEKLFFGKARCFSCHFGENFTDNRFHNTGIGWDAEKSLFRDKGRYNVTLEIGEIGRFKTPTLRNVARRPPFMHDGSLPDLRTVVLHYNRGGILNPNLSPEIQPLNLAQDEIRNLIEFLDALTDSQRQNTPPALFPQ
ncbi:MAG: cytochrome c peroxidase [Gemmatimonadota bacterium]|nr:cytochrome c peroxidase [Gemmatimonadota bacterium]